MKRLLTLFLGLAFLVGTVGCPKKEPKKEPPKGGAAAEPEKKPDTKPTP